MIYFVEVLCPHLMSNQTTIRMDRTWNIMTFTVLLFRLAILFSGKGEDIESCHLKSDHHVKIPTN